MLRTTVIANGFLRSNPHAKNGRLLAMTALFVIPTGQILKRFSVPSWIKT